MAQSTSKSDKSSSTGYLSGSSAKKKSKKKHLKDTMGEAKERLYDKSSMAHQSVKVSKQSAIGRRSGER